MSESVPGQRSFEDALAELERVVRDLEDGQLGLDEALSQYEQGVALIKQCHGQLGQAEQRILLLTGAESDGQPILQPFEHQATARSMTNSRARKRETGSEY